LRVPDDFNETNRIVFLKGEAYFSILKADLPFSVKTDFASVRVVGTKFNVKVRDDLFEAVVNEGSIEVSSKATNDSSVTLSKGNLTRFQKGEPPTSPQQKWFREYPGWTHGKMAFYKTRLKEVLIEIERRFDVTINLMDQSLENVIITALFEGDALDNILSAICKLIKKNWRIKNENYIIY